MIGFKHFAATVRRRVARAAVLSGFAVLALVCALIALVFLAIALYAWLGARSGAPLAALGTAAAAMLVAFCVFLIAALFLRPSRKAESERDFFEAELRRAMGDRLAKKITTAVAQHGLAATLAALMAGVLLGLSPRLRQLLRKLADL